MKISLLITMLKILCVTTFTFSSVELLRRKFNSYIFSINPHKELLYLLPFDNIKQIEINKLALKNLDNIEKFGDSMFDDHLIETIFDTNNYRDKKFVYCDIASTCVSIQKKLETSNKDEHKEFLKKLDVKIQEVSVAQKDLLIKLYCKNYEFNYFLEQCIINEGKVYPEPKNHQIFVEIAKQIVERRKAENHKQINIE